MDSPTYSSMTSQDERIMAVVAHLAFLIPYVGVVVPILLWVTQKDKSKFVKFQALQATAFQVVLFGASIVGGVCYMLSFFGMMFSMPSNGGSGSPGAGLFLPFAVIMIWIFGGLAAFIYSIIAAVQCFRGEDFRYVFLGDWLASWLQS